MQAFILIFILIFYKDVRKCVNFHRKFTKVYYIILVLLGIVWYILEKLNKGEMSMIAIGSDHGGYKIK